MRILRYCLLVFVLLTNFNLSVTENKINLDWHPSNFPGSTWSANGEMTFYVKGEEEEDRCLFFKCEKCGELNICAEVSTKAEFVISGKTNTCLVDMCFADDFMYLISSDVPELVSLAEINEYIIAKLDIVYKSQEHFTATVLKSNVLSVGTVYEFYRLEGAQTVALNSEG